MPGSVVVTTVPESVAPSRSTPRYRERLVPACIEPADDIGVGSPRFDTQVAQARDLCRGSQLPGGRDGIARRCSSRWRPVAARHRRPLGADDRDPLLAPFSPYRCLTVNRVRRPAVSPCAGEKADRDEHHQRDDDDPRQVKPAMNQVRPVAPEGEGKRARCSGRRRSASSAASRPRRRGGRMPPPFRAMATHGRTSAIGRRLAMLTARAPRARRDRGRRRSRRW